MDDTDLYFKQQAHFNICSDADDSNSFPSSTWFPENNRRRKSRLGTHHKRNQRVFSNLSSNNDDISSSNKENIYLPFSSDISTSDPAQYVNTRTEQPKPPSSTLNGELTMSPFSFSVAKFNDQKSASLSIPRVFDDSSLSPLVKSLEQPKCMMSPFPPCLPEDEIDGILQKINLPDTVETSLFFLSTNPNSTRTSVLKLKNSFDARVSQNLITNQCQTTETKLNQLILSTTRNTGSKCENLAVQTNNSTPRFKSSNNQTTNTSSESISQKCSADCTNPIDLPINSFSVLDPASKNSVGDSIELVIKRDDSYSKYSSELPHHSACLPIEDVPSLPIHPIVHSNNSSSTCSLKNAADFQNPDKVSGNLLKDDKLNREILSEPISVSNVADIPSTAKLLGEPIPVSAGHKTTGSLVTFHANLEQNKSLSGRYPNVSPLETLVAMLSEKSKPVVDFVEPAVIRESAVSRNSMKSPSIITVRDKSYKLLNILGKGGSSVVYQVSHPETNELLAVKKVDLPDEDDDITEGYLNEVQMLENLQNCDVIIRIFDHQLVYKNGKKTLYVVMEKGDTDLSNLIRSVNEAKKLSIPMIIYYWTEMLAAVNEVHRRGIIHSDLKPANFVLVRGRLKLIDFGIASSIQGDMTSVCKDSFCGTLNYMSPEATSYIRYPSGTTGYKVTFKTDVWSLGCILYNLVYSRLPFYHIKKRMDKICAIVSPTANIDFPEKKDVPPILISLLKACLEKDYKRRPTVQELLDRTMRIFQCSCVE